MYSKAGLRILDFAKDAGEELRPMTTGNTLYRQQESGHLQSVSSMQPPGLTVAVSGWSWGGQFVDVDNDGFLDIHAVSGYYTTPEAVAINLDT